MRAVALRHGVKVYEYANAGNHVHLLLRARRRSEFQAFLRAFAGLAARLVTGARRGRPVGKFWDELAYSRVIHWGREFVLVREYVIQNELESLGRVPYRPRHPRRRSRKPPDG
jgi:hypothetical protein